jgi:hypothetical protein
MTRPARSKGASFVIVERLDADHRDRICFVLEEPAGRAVTQKQFRARVWCITKLRDLGYFKPPRKEKGRARR